MAFNKTDRLVDYMKMGNITFPKILLLNYKKLKITNEELIVLIYLLNYDLDNYNPKVMAKELGIKTNELLVIISNLCEKQIISINLVKNDKGILEEKMSVDLLYNKLAMIILNGTIESENKTKSLSLYEIFEQEFARSLSPMEFEIINKWLEKGYSEEIIIEALKESIFNGVNSLRYIDRILLEWKKKRINTKEDVIKYQTKYKQKKNEKVEVFDYDWLNGD